MLNILLPVLLWASPQTQTAATVEIPADLDLSKMQLIAEHVPTGTEVRLRETADSIELVSLSSQKVGPHYSFDINANGQIDARQDRGYGWLDGTRGCVSLLLSETSSTGCSETTSGRAVGQEGPGGRVTYWSIPKREIASNGASFGWRLRLWNRATEQHVTAGPASGTYRFGDQARLASANTLPLQLGQWRTIERQAAWLVRNDLFPWYYHIARIEGRKGDRIALEWSAEEASDLEPFSDSDFTVEYPPNSSVLAKSKQATVTLGRDGEHLLLFKQLATRGGGTTDNMTLTPRAFSPIRLRASRR